MLTFNHLLQLTSVNRNKYNTLFSYTTNIFTTFAL